MDALRKYVIASGLLALSLTVQATQLQHPFGPNVILFDPSMSATDINQKVRAIYHQQNQDEFSEQRIALVFAPGQYQQNIDIRVGYYTQVLGLGNQPDDVTLTGAVRTQDRSDVGSTSNYWRSAENLAIKPTLGSLTDSLVPKDQNVWAVSKAATLRRIHIIDGSLRLYDKGDTNGGYIASTRVEKLIYTGTQPVWFVRNSAFGLWEGKTITTFLGMNGTVRLDSWPALPYTVISHTPISREKPYLIYDNASQQYAVTVKAIRHNTIGTDWQVPGTAIPISQFYIAHPGATAADLNQALQQGKHLFFTPGVYHLQTAIRIQKPNTILFGIGFATLVNDNAQPAIMVDDVPGVQIAGILLEAGANNATTLLQVGDAVNNQTYADPVFLYDVFCRIGGTQHDAGKAKSCLTINSNDVVIDNTWLWRANSGNNNDWTKNTSDYGLVVNGKRVIVYNLTADNHQKYQVNWQGDFGNVYHFVSELPADVPSQADWQDGALNGYSAFKIADSVTQHRISAATIYSQFKNAIWLDRGISKPSTATIEHIIGIASLRQNAGIKHMINNIGCGIDNMHRSCAIPLA